MEAGSCSRLHQLVAGVDPSPEMKEPLPSEPRPPSRSKGAPRIDDWSSSLAYEIVALECQSSALVPCDDERGAHDRPGAIPYNVYHCLALFHYAPHVSVAQRILASLPAGVHGVIRQVSHPPLSRLAPMIRHSSSTRTREHDPPRSTRPPDRSAIGELLLSPTAGHLQ